MGMLGPGAQSAERADVDDASAAMALHDARRLLAAEEGCLEVDRVDEVPIRLGNIEGIEAGESGGVVDEAVEAAKALLHVGEHAPDCGDGFQVGPKELGAAAFLGGTAGFGL